MASVAGTVISTSKVKVNRSRHKPQA